MFNRIVLSAILLAVLITLAITCITALKVVWEPSVESMEEPQEAYYLSSFSNNNPLIAQFVIGNCQRVDELPLGIQPTLEVGKSVCFNDNEQNILLIFATEDGPVSWHLSPTQHQLSS